MWALIFLSIIVAALAGFVFLISRIYKLKWIEQISKGKRGVRIIFSMIPLILLIAVPWFLMGSMNAITIVLHLVVFWLIADLLTLGIEKLRKQRFQRAVAAPAAIIFTMLYLLMAWFLATNVWSKHYTVETEKEVGQLRIVQFADSHVGTTFDGKQFRTYVDRMQAENPDIVLITGDYVDDDTTREDMIAACEALGTLQTTYGIYYAFGNHDKGYYGEQYRGYGAEDLINELERNGVTVLQDETILIDDRFYVIGRQDKVEEQLGGDRAKMTDLTAGIDQSKFSIVLDHQPQDYKNQEEAKVDLVLSGHTHGGQLIPLNIIGELFQVNDKIYGIEKRNQTTFIVTSGISDWALDFKTGCKSEYVVIDIQ